MILNIFIPSLRQGFGAIAAIPSVAVSCKTRAALKGSYPMLKDMRALKKDFDTALNVLSKEAHDERKQSA
jgi:glutamine synthetase type III